jgi:purine-nucleoside phosphorylase
VKEIADWLLERVEMRPKIAIVCGSGLGGLGDRMKNTTIFPYESVPNFPKSTVQGHKGNLIFGYLNEVEVVCMQGRFHAYEGYSNSLCTLPMKVFKLLGVRTIVLTCAAGGVNPEYNVGDIMMIKDHLAPVLWTLQNPLVGHNDEQFGPRFPPVNRLYSKELRNLFSECAKELNIELKEGVYSSFGGPNYESVTELRALRMFGVDSVGMSVAHEALVAGYCGMEVMALSLITNKAVLDYDSELTANHEEVMAAANARAKDIEALVMSFVAKLQKRSSDSNNNICQKNGHH